MVCVWNFMKGDVKILRWERDIESTRLQQSERAVERRLLGEAVGSQIMGGVLGFRVFS